MTERPTLPENPTRQHRLRGQFATRDVSGRTLDQWQYEVTAGGRIWYCPDEQRRVVRVVAASPGHPKATEQEVAQLPVDAPRGIRVVLDAMTASRPAGTVLAPEDIACGVRYLVSDDAAMVRGTTLAVDGGISATRMG